MPNSNAPSASSVRSGGSSGSKAEKGSYTISLKRNSLFFDYEVFSLNIHPASGTPAVNVRAPSAGVRDLVSRLLEPCMVMNANVFEAPNSEMEPFLGNSPLVADQQQRSVLGISKKAVHHNSTVYLDELTLRFSGDTLLTLPADLPDKSLLSRAKPDLILGFHDGMRTMEADAETPALVISVRNNAAFKNIANCGTVHCPLFPFYVEERNPDFASEFYCQNQLIGGLRTALNAWRLIDGVSQCMLINQWFMSMHCDRGGLPVKD
ncbi:hypothetical protein DFS34DRAFT_698152 [Phlyctochytrium arcticum]|nr:hypothetical protein DFS34DRAFT_698710 [Phlyctochytrium arcticum]KAI9089874.1 hypothetical protein DFS34DRAFT_698152 [Phlyctochytrium arcticum]